METTVSGGGQEDARVAATAAFFNTPLHLERLDDTRHDTSANGNVAGEGALLVNVLELARLSQGNGGRWDPA
jgi:hypothetical protein